MVSSIGLFVNLNLPILYIHACSMRYKWEELEICVQLRGCDIVGITEMCWDGSHDWYVAKKGYRLFRKDRPGR